MDQPDYISIREVEARRLKADYEAERAKWEAQAALNRAAEADVDRQISEAALLKIKQSNRPSFMLGAELTMDEAGNWVASFGALYTVGHSPESAFDNFDHTWLNGQQEEPRKQ